VDPLVIVMFAGAVDHVGAWLFTVIEIVAPTEMAGEALSATAILKLQVWAGTGAVKLRLQFTGDAPEPLTATVKPHEAPLFEQVSVWVVSESFATPIVWLYTDPPLIVMFDGAADHVGA